MKYQYTVYKNYLGRYSLELVNGIGCGGITGRVYRTIEEAQTAADKANSDTTTSTK